MSWMIPRILTVFLAYDLEISTLMEIAKRESYLNKHLEAIMIFPQPFTILERMGLW